MARQQQSFGGLNTHLVTAVPATAFRILDVGCGDGQIGKALKEAGPPGRQVFGIERNAEAAEAAEAVLDAVYRLDVTREASPIAAKSLDCIIFSEVLEYFPDPAAVIRDLRGLLKDDGTIICAVTNAQNYAVVTSLFTNDFQYQESGTLDRDKVRLFTLSSLYKTLLDAEFLPRLLHTTLTPCPHDLWQAAVPLAGYFRIHPDDINVRLSAYRYIASATPLPAVTAEEEPMSFVVCSNDPAQLENNLAASPCFRSGKHELLVMDNASSAADGINGGLSKAAHGLVVAVHQDVYIPEGWPARFQSQWRLAEQSFGRLGVAGVFGVSRHGGQTLRTGRVINGGQLMSQGYVLPAPAISLDEVVLAFPRDTEIRLDPAVGWHCYGTDAVLQALRAGGQAAILEAPCLHNTRFSGLGQDFVLSAQALGEKWSEQLPIHTPCIRISEKCGLSGW